MKIKIDDKWYTPGRNKIAIVFEDWELEQIKTMTPETHPNNRIISGVFDDAEHCKIWAGH